jgi:hypothetical protein
VTPQPYKWALASSRRFSVHVFLQGEVVNLIPNPQTGGPDLRIYTPQRRWVAQVPRDCHFPRPLTWAPDGYVRIAISRTHLHGPLRGTSGLPFPAPTYVGPWGVYYTMQTRICGSAVVWWSAYDQLKAAALDVMKKWHCENITLLFLLQHIVHSGITYSLHILHTFMLGF